MQPDATQGRLGPLKESQIHESKVLNPHQAQGRRRGPYTLSRRSAVADVSYEMQANSHIRMEVCDLDCIEMCPSFRYGYNIHMQNHALQCELIEYWRLRDNLIHISFKIMCIIVHI